MRAALYARFSTDRQSETSAADQLRLCRQRAERDGLTIVAEYRDEAVSGSVPVGQRPGAKQLLAESGDWDVLLVESLDRISRDSAELEMTIRRLEHRRIRIVGVSDGYDSTQTHRKLMRGIKGVIAQQYLEELAWRTHRGLSGVVARGHHAGGISYGYRTVPAEGGNVLEIDGEKAAVVRDIFRRFAGGDSCQRIAADLNARSVRGPRGTWSVSAIYGSPNKGTGILCNELYVGRYIWNRSQWVKDPDSGKRQRVERPRGEWCIQQREDLRIVSDALWGAVRARMNTPYRQSGTKGKGLPPKTLLGGLLTCGICGAAVIAVNSIKYGCAAHKDRGDAVCSSRTLVRKDIAERRILDTLKADLLSPASMAFIHAEVRRLQREQAPVDHSKRIAELEREIVRIGDAIVAVGVSESLADRLKRAEAEKASLLRERLQEPVDLAGIADRYRALVARLDEALGQDIPQSRAVLRDVLGAVRIEDREDGIYAVMKRPAVALLSVAGVSRSGSGGRIFDLETAVLLQAH
jgi:DNA invertase Pin-like site-specific DNA recombinase